MLVGIITIIDRNNYGNRLQNYALNYYCNHYLKISTQNLDNNPYFNNKKHLFYRKVKQSGKDLIKNLIRYDKTKKLSNREKNFLEFDKLIPYAKKRVDASSSLKKYDYLIVGSDQVWNPSFHRLSDVDVLKKIPGHKKISYAASFGMNSIKNQENILDGIANFKALSVREEKGKEILEEITGRKDIEVHIDPTLLLTREEWDKLIKKPSVLPKKKYILCFFLGNLSKERNEEIKRVAKEKNYDIIYLHDKKSPYYESGPKEFLYFIKNASLICTDSYHASIFSFLYNLPFVIFKRDQEEFPDMSSRIDTFIKRFGLQNQKVNGKKITEENLHQDYSKAYQYLEEERKKSRIYLEKNLK